MPDPTKRAAAIEAAALMWCSGLAYPRCAEACGHCKRRLASAIAAYLAAMGRDIEAKLVREGGEDG